MRSYTKVQEDPALVRRAMLFLRLTGKVLYHEMEQAAAEGQDAQDAHSRRERVSCSRSGWWT